MPRWSWNRSELRYSPNMTRWEKTAVIHSTSKYPPIHFQENQKHNKHILWSNQIPPYIIVQNPHMAHHSLMYVFSSGRFSVFSSVTLCWNVVCLMLETFSKHFCYFPNLECHRELSLCKRLWNRSRFWYWMLIGQKSTLKVRKYVTGMMWNTSSPAAVYITYIGRLTFILSSHLALYLPEDTLVNRHIGEVHWLTWKEVALKVKWDLTLHWCNND